MVDVVGLTTTEPEVALPVLKLVPVHEVALVLDHVTVTEAPEATELEETESVATGAGTTVTVLESSSEPPTPVQETV